MQNVTTTPELSHSTTESNSHLFDDWFDPIETGIHDRVRGLIEEIQKVLLAIKPSVSAGGGGAVLVPRPFPIHVDQINAST
jgi:hypothetical protein